jgi:hypothetical protein
MIVRPSVVVDPRDTVALLAEIQARRPGYVPEWKPASSDPGQALVQIAARYAEALVQRLNQAPDKNKLAFLDMLGQQPSPARASRAPIVFQLAAGVASGSAPAGTEIAAPPPPGSNQQVVFETEKETGVSAGKLSQVFSFWPGRDEYIDHSTDYLAGNQVNLFDNTLLTGVPHILYLAHSILLNLSGNVVLSVEFQLTHPSSDPLEIEWEYWDGKIWRGFVQINPDCQPQAIDPNDGTNGLTSSGSIRLSAGATKGNTTAVNGITAYWIRGRLDQTLPPDPRKRLPEVENIRISSLVSKSLTGRLTGLAAQAQAATGPMLLFHKFAAVTPNTTLNGSLVNEAGQALAGAAVVISDPDPSNTDFGKITATTGNDGTFTAIINDFGTNKTLQFEVTFFSVTASTQITVPSVNYSIQLTLKVSGLGFDKAYSDGTKLDTSKPFLPFGAQPQPGTVFYFNSAEVFTKPGARFRIYLPKTAALSDQLRNQSATSIHGIDHLVVWEYWDGRQWTTLPSLPAIGTQTVSSDFTVSEVLDFRVPLDLAPVAVNRDMDLWMRARLVSGGYGFTQLMSFQTGAHANNNFTVMVTQPPMLASAALGYAWQFGPFHPDTALTFSDFLYQDHTYEATWPGASFLPYQRTQDLTPTLYLGFDKKPPTADLGIFFDIVEQASASAPPAMFWEYWDGFQWSVMPIEDETGNLTAPGILSYVAEDDSAPLARFGTALYWLRGRLKEDGPPLLTAITGIYPNAVWAQQRRSYQDVAIGTATGQPGEIFQVVQIPVIPGERLEVQELSGARANVEWRLVALDVSKGDTGFVRDLEAQLGKEGPASDIVEGDLRLKRNKQKLVSEVWVRWYGQRNLFLSRPNDRHYAIDRARGLVFFGDGSKGRSLPQDAQVVLRQFQSGGGTEGNVAARTITQLLGAISGVQSVFNPHAAEGGSDGETLPAFRERAPASVRARGRTLTAGDYEAMVREASSAVAVVKAIPNRNPVGRLLPGWLTIFIIPDSKAPRPYPSKGMRDEVLTYIAERAPAGLVASGRINVTGPLYHPLDISAVFVPVDESEAGSVETAAAKALGDFLHPLYGGPSSNGWDFGRGVYLSDVAVVLESVQGMDHAESIELLVNNQVLGEFAPVPADQIVVGGNIRLKGKSAGD